MSILARIRLVIFNFCIIWMLNWCMWIWKWGLWRELLGSYWGQKSLLACTRSILPKYVLGRARLSDVVQASDLLNKALLPQVSRLQMAIKPGVKFYLHSLTGMFKPPSNFSIIPMKAFRKRPLCPKISVAGSLMLVWHHQLAEIQCICHGWCFGCIRAQDGRSFHHPRAPTVNCTCWRTAAQEQKYGLGDWIRKKLQTLA